MSGDAAAEALRMVAAVRDDPARRLMLAGSFYDDRPGRAPIRAYRRAELAFMRWQVQRGGLAAPDSARPGSAWWRSVNEGLLRDAWEADRLLAGRPGPASGPPVSRWADFLRPRTWTSPGCWISSGMACPPTPGPTTGTTRGRPPAAAG